MWIRNTNPATRRLYDSSLTDEDGEPLMDEAIEFSENGTVQVSKEIGEALIAAYSSIEPMVSDD